MAKSPAIIDDLKEMTFPFAGLELTHPFGIARLETTPVAENVRAIEPMTGRARGGSRSGLDKYVAEQHSGENPIQHLNYIVTVSGEMIGWDFDVPPSEFEGPHFGISFINVDLGLAFDFDLDPDAITPIGYPPTNQTVRRSLRLAITDAARISNSGLRAIVPVGEEATITMTLRDGNGESTSNETVKIHTDPPAPGDGDTASTIFDLSDPPDGTAEFTVSNTEPGVVTYWGTVESILGHRQKSRNEVRIRFVPYKLTVTVDNATWPADGTITRVRGHLVLGGTSTPVAGKTITLSATGTVSGALPAVTAVTDASGDVEFEVSSAIEETVTYSLTEQSDDVPSFDPETETIEFGASAYRQSAFASAELVDGPTTMQASLDVDVLEGSLLVIAVSRLSRTSAVASFVSVVDSEGRTLSLAATETQDLLFAENESRLYYVANAPAGPCTITVTIAYEDIDFASWVSVAIHEYTGMFTAGDPLVAFNSDKGESTTPNPGSAAIDSEGDLIFAFFTCANASSAILLTSAAVTSPFTTREEELEGRAQDKHTMGTADYVPAAITETCSWTLSNSMLWVAIAASFKKA